MKEPVETRERPDLYAVHGRTALARPVDRQPYRLTVVAQEIPFPPRHGGQVDVWRRLEAFARRGVRVQLVCWSAEPPGALERTALLNVTESWVPLTFKQSWSARLHTASRILAVPGPVGTRRLDAAERQAVQAAVADFQPHAIWLDQLYGAGLALRLAGGFGVPLLTRSHNVEHRYWREQLSVMHDARETLKIHGRLLSLERFETRVLRTSRRFYDISVDDLEYWRARGLDHGRWLPPLADRTAAAATSVENATHDIGFVGNLFMPNNVEAVEWLLRHVLPAVRARVPGATALLAGSRPVDAVRRLVAADPLTELWADVADPRDVFEAARVLVNPMLRGGGVALKSIDMLASGRPIVTTPQGVSGVPPQVKACFAVADGAQAFAAGIAACLEGGRTDPLRTQRALQLFSDRAYDVVLDDLRELARRPRSTAADHH